MNIIAATAATRARIAARAIGVRPLAEVDADLAAADERYHAGRVADDEAALAEWQRLHDAFDALAKLASAAAALASAGARAVDAGVHVGAKRGDMTAAVLQNLRELEALLKSKRAADLKRGQQARQRLDEIEALAELRAALAEERALAEAEQQ